MKCPNCQTENPDNKKFCHECGAKLILICPQCGGEILPSDKFCGECGHKLDFPLAEDKLIPEAEGERKHVTVLFSDLSGYTAMSEKLDPEEVKEILSRIFGEIAQVVTKYEGFIEKFVGDAVMALFGVPKVHEDDPVRAVRAAREIHDLVKILSPKLEQKIGQPLAVHTGINTGLVVTGEVDVGKGTHGVVGDTLNLASRLADMAGPGEILTSFETHELISPYFETKPLGAVNIKGKSQPMTPYLVVGELAIRTRLEASERRGFTAFTGREQELATLHSCLDEAAAGNGQFVTVVGEAGVGKSRLIYEFRHSLDRNKITVLEGRCQSYGRGTPYFSLLDALRRGLRLQEEDTPGELLEKTIAGILGVDQSLEQYLPLYLHLLAIPSEEYPLPKRLQGQELTNAFQDALAAVNILNSNRHPMVLILEDWHWVDEASDSALRHIASVIAPHSLMVVVIYRPEYTSSWGHWGYHTPIVLSPLDSHQSENIVKSVLRADQIPEGLVPLIHDRTAGNPFFIEEICNALTEEGSVEVSDRRAYLRRSLKHLSLPETVEGVIQARLDRLDRNARESLRLASVIGREFARRILERITTFPEQLSQSLEALKVLELIQQIRVIPEAAYMFKHVLTQEVTYKTLLRQKRKELHGLVGRAIEELYQERIEEQVNLLHHHFSLAENWPKAVEYGRQAANRAYGLSQFHEAVTLLEQTQNCLLRLPEDRNRQETLISIQLKMNWPLINLGNLDRALLICGKAEAIARSLSSSVFLGKVFHQYHMIYFFKNQYKKAEQYALQALEQLEGSGEDSLILLLKLNLAAANFSLAQWEKAAQLYSEVIRTQEANNAQTEYLEEQPYLPYTHSCTHLGYIRALQGRVEETKKLIRKGSAPELEQVANLQSRVWCAVWHSTFSALVGEDYGALARVEGILKIAEKTDSPILCFLGYAAKGNALMAAEDFEAAHVVYKQALKAIEGTGHRRFLESVYYSLVQSTLELGDGPVAERYYQAGLPLVELNPQKEASKFDYLKGRLLASSSPPEFEQAELFFEKSIRADAKSGAVVSAAQTRFYLAQMLAQKGERDRSRTLLNELRSQFQKWRIPFWQKKCEQELEDLDSRK
jgi:class 3 adenylate cyclase/tetratricopeptide (TPR) repeat protein